MVRMFSTPKAFASSVATDNNEEAKLQRQAKDIVEENDYRVNESDDEEISEDNAFDEEDEIKYGHHFKSDSDAPSDFEEDEDAVGLDAMLDEDSEDNVMQVNQNIQEDGIVISFDEESTGSEYEGTDDEGVVDNVLEKMDEYDMGGKPAKKKLKQEHQTEAYEENEFNVAIQRHSTTELTLDQLLHGAQAQSQEQSKILQAPLPPLHQQKLDRIKAYKASVDEVSKWTPIIQQNRQADHLEFPLKGNQGGDGDIARTGCKSLVKTFKPQSALEQKIAAILQKAVPQQDDDFVQVGGPTKEQIKQQRIEQQKIRSKQFYEEIKRKRAAKNKSKKFHRVVKREIKRAEKKNSQ